MTQVIAEGVQSLYASTIRGISTLKVNGNDSMTGTNVISEVVYGDTFIAWINGTNYDIYHIYCNSTDICKIGCQSSSACTKLYLHCFGTCYVDCDEENGIDCPFFGVYLDWVAPSPTTIPTGIPSTDPSTVSTTTSAVPTVIPFAVPSAVPTAFPKVVNITFFIYVIQLL